jgi:hypothetical protein
MLCPRVLGVVHFLPSRYKLCELYACRGTSLIGAANLSPVTKLAAGTGTVSRRVPRERSEQREYKLSRSQIFITMQDFNCVQMRALPNVAERSWVSGCSNHYEFVLSAGALPDCRRQAGKAKSVTNK